VQARSSIDKGINVKKLPAATLMLAGLAFGMPMAHAEDGQLYGLLRSRDLTPFGFLRLDIRPAHAVSIEPGDWAFETELSYQNTWALSPNVEKYLSSQESGGRRDLTAQDVQAIGDLPGENYLVDLELALLDVTFHYKFSDVFTGYLIASGVSYQGGFLDSTIEGFHSTFGFSSFGRPAVSKNQVNLIYDLKSSQYTSLGAPTDGGLLDPTFGLRYSGWTLPGKWNLSAELAVKVPLAGRRELLSTGRTDYGVQMSLQRKGRHHAFYLDAATVYYDGSTQVSRQEPQWIPTLIVGYELMLTKRTNINVQGYLSQSVYTHQETDLKELLGEKYQYSIGVRHRRNNFLFTFGITENLQNVNNTPDIGFQLGLAWVPLSPTTR
jgi:hypothetical protein